MRSTTWIARGVRCAISMRWSMRPNCVTPTTPISRNSSRFSPTWRRTCGCSQNIARCALRRPLQLDESVLASRGITRLPTNLGESLAAFEAEPTLTNAFGSDLVESIVAVRQSEMELFADASDEDLAAATRWLH